ncbi:MAG: lysylphosphatidylglycerol synthase transmembrane domain-containing protein [Verrucomicrobiota bacterium]|nr:lysylphosphatidylglycerol synthase transmembrane domain-containing protein [Verrucomicrobiota bacterium]
MKPKKLKYLISIVIGVTLFAYVYHTVDFSNVITLFQSAKPNYLVLSLFLFIPTTILTGYRFQLIIPSDKDVSLWDCIRLFLAACSLNLVLPSKAGDLSKVFFINQHCNTPKSLGFGLVIFERAMDLAALLFCGLIGLTFCNTQKQLLLIPIIASSLLIIILFFLSKKLLSKFIQTILSRFISDKNLNSFQESISELQDQLLATPYRTAYIATLSLLVWAMHLMQIWLFCCSIGIQVSPFQGMGLTSVAILVGLLPLTFAGLGTRDAALFFLYKPFASIDQAATIGLFCSLRYVVMGIAGVPFFGHYIINYKKNLGEQSKTEVPMTK